MKNDNNMNSMKYENHHYYTSLLQLLHEYNQWNSIQMVIMISCQLSAFPIIYSILIIISEIILFLDKYSTMILFLIFNSIQ